MRQNGGTRCSEACGIWWFQTRIYGAQTRELAARHRVHRPMVRTALTDVVPPARKVPERPHASCWLG